MEREKKAKQITQLLDEVYGIEIKCFLNYTKDYELLFATILSAQCTDERVNIVTESLFKKYSTLESFAAADETELQEDIRSTGFFRQKAKNIILSAQKIISEYDGKVPDSIEKLTTLPGVGRKTANIALGELFGIPCVAVDTHVKRVSYKLGLTDNTEPDKIEKDLSEILPQENQIRYNAQIISHGRAVCKARNPLCGKCVFFDLCERKPYN
ncbi:MAG: endonuclease III [Clostridiales bacterium]|jgi:endonuclease-3|nr:endonuclease III [Clostridiales bacterium]